MEFKLDEIINIFNLIASVDAYSLPLWFSFAIPAFYVAFKKLTIKPDDTPKGWVERIVELASLPKVESGILILSLVLFVIGVFSLKYGQNQKEEIRKAGLAVKNYCMNKNSYCPALHSVLKDTSMDSCIITQLEEEYPSQFWIDKTFPTSPTLVLTDSVAFFAIMDKSQKLLEAYLSSDSIKEGSLIPYNLLFNINTYFTTRLIDQFIADHGDKFTWDTLPQTNRYTPYHLRYGIIKR